jgi:filamentous hemagglutinin family protein
MKARHETRKALWLAVLIWPAGRALPVFANPSGLTVSTGHATVQQLGALLNVTVSQTALLNWQSFNLAAGETTTFLQPSASSVVFNVIGSGSPSQILGHLNANGTVILANASGFYFGDGSVIKVGGSFIATTAPLAPDFGSGATWQFAGLPPLASIVNYGQIQVGQGRSLFLIAENIQNYGSLAAPGGQVELAAGQSVLVSDSADGRGLSATVQLPAGSVDNFGQITADAGVIALAAKVVNQDGLLQANSLQNQNGAIELVASDTVTLGANSTILAQGDASAGGSAGGNITIQSGNVFSDAAGSQLIATGGANGGNGGNVEVSAPDIESLNSTMKASAQSGFIGGLFLLDPVNIELGTSSSFSGTVPASGTVGASSGSGTLQLNVNTAFKNKSFSEILLAATGNISLDANTTWNLSSSTGETSGQLTLEAGGNITFGSGAKIMDGNDWSVALYAGYNFANNTVNPGVGNIYLNGGSGKSGSGSIRLESGSVDLQAGESVLVGSGSVSTLGGGDIYVYAAAGDINAGTANGGYVYNASGTSVPNPGGIATAAGGAVTLIAGNNITSVPTVPGTIPQNQSVGASGAYGAGDVTVIAGGQIAGNYTLANGTGTLLAGVAVTSAQASLLQNPADHPTTYAATLQSLESAVTTAQNVNGNIGTESAPVILNLIAGSWNAWAANNIYLQEVRNPSGTFNTDLQFDYAANAAVNLWAGNGITLDGGNLDGQSLQRLAGYDDSMGPIYAPILTLNAGAGGITVGSSLYLYPSSQGALQITTRDGGCLTGALTGDSSLFGITMSGAGQPSGSESYEYQAIQNNDQAATPLHLGDANPVVLDISGSIGNFQLSVPTFAHITVDGLSPYVANGQDYFGTYNFGFSGRNLSASQTTSIQVAGSISYRGDLTIAALNDPLPASLLDSSTDPEVTDHLVFDAATGSLIYIGVMSATDLAFLLNPTVYTVDANGATQIASLTLSPAQTAALNALYTASQSAQISKESLALTGPGKFSITADAIDLGISGGIVVNPLDAQSAAISDHGAALNITTAGDLDMTASEIANESLGGNINLTVGGTLNVGGEYTAFDDPNAAKGIFTTSGGNVSATALTGDVNVNSSRIAAYDGGSVSVVSKNGDVNAGIGGAGYVSVEAQELDSAGQLIGLTQSIPGSGILATTLPGGDAALGNITISAPKGSVNASLGGVIQIAFNGNGSRSADVQIDAGGDINASGSGIIGSNLKMTAGGSINGVIIGSAGIDLSARNNVDVTAVSSGNVDINASGTVAGTIVGGGEVSVSGDSITAAVMGGSVSTSGDTAGASLGVSQPNVSHEVAQPTDALASASAAAGSDDEDQKKKKSIPLAQKVSRVTVLLPPKN